MSDAEAEMTYVLSPPGTYRIVSGVFAGILAPSPGEVITIAGIAVSATENVWPCPLVYEIVYEPPVVTAGTMPSYQAGPAMGSLYLRRTPLQRTALSCGSLTVLLSQRRSTNTWLRPEKSADRYWWP